MIALYTVILLLLGVVAFVVRLRAKTLERKFSRLALTVTQLAGQAPHRSGNSGRAEACLAAKHQFELGQLIQKRDRFEGKYFRWQHTAEKFSKWVKAVRAWKGRKLPYTFGVIDVSVLLYLVDHFGLGRVDLTSLADTISKLLTR